MIYIVIFWNYINILEVFKIKALILEPHKWNLCETNSIQKTTKFIINIMSKNHEKIINYFYPTTVEKQQSWWYRRIWNKNKNRERSYSNIFNCLQHYRMKNARSCVKRCSFTQNLAKTFVEWGHKIKFPEFNINRKTIFFVKN